MNATTPSATKNEFFRIGIRRKLIETNKKNTNLLIKGEQQQLSPQVSTSKSPPRKPDGKGDSSIDEPHHAFNRDLPSDRELPAIDGESSSNASSRHRAILASREVSLNGTRKAMHEDLWHKEVDVIASIDSGTKHKLEEAVEKLQTKLELALHPAELEMPIKPKRDIKRPPMKVD